MAGSVALMGAWTFSQSPRPFYYDSGLYWSLGRTFDAGGHFSLLHFNSALRGYFLPLLDHLLHECAHALSWNDSSLAKLVNVLILASLGSVLLPRLAELAWPDRPWGVIRRLVLSIILLVLWGGYLPFPLSDLPAVWAVVVVLVAVAHDRVPLAMLVAGAAAGLAIDMRPAYVLVAPVLAVMIAIAWWSGPADHLRRSLGVGLAIVGFAVVSLPQSLATHRHFGSWSFIPGSTAGLSSLQYTDGMAFQLYNTYVGRDKPPQMNYVDETGTKLLREHGGSVRTTAQYAGIIVHHPIEMLGLFARHVINGLDQRYDTPYVPRLRISDWWMRLGGFAFVFVALARLAVPATRRTLGPARWRYPVALAASGVTAIASAVEPRFMLPSAFVSYMVVLTPGWSELAERSARPARPVLLGVAVLAGLAAFVAIVVTVIHGASKDLVFG